MTQQKTVSDINTARGGSILVASIIEFIHLQSQNLKLNVPSKVQFSKHEKSDHLISSHVRFWPFDILIDQAVHQSRLIDQ